MKCMVPTQILKMLKCECRYFQTNGGNKITIKNTPEGEIFEIQITKYKTSDRI